MKNRDTLIEQLLQNLNRQIVHLNWKEFSKYKPQSQFVVGFQVHNFKYKKEMKSTQKQPSCTKRLQPSKSLVQNSCEIKGGGHEMASIMLMIINI